MVGTEEFANVTAGKKKKTSSAQELLDERVQLIGDHACLRLNVNLAPEESVKLLNVVLYGGFSASSSSAPLGNLPLTSANSRNRVACSAVS